MNLRPIFTDYWRVGIGEPKCLAWMVNENGILYLGTKNLWEVLGCEKMHKPDFEDFLKEIKEVMEQKAIVDEYFIIQLLSRHKFNDFVDYVILTANCVRSNVTSVKEDSLPISQIFPKGFQDYFCKVAGVERSKVWPV